MNSEKIWTAVLIISILAACISAAAVLLSVIDGEMLQVALSAISAILFVSSAILAAKIRSKVISAEEPDDEVECLRLKKPGIERSDDERIVPKGKMPKV